MPLGRREPLVLRSDVEFVASLVLVLRQGARCARRLACATTSRCFRRKLKHACRFPHKGLATSGARAEQGVEGSLSLTWGLSVLETQSMFAKRVFLARPVGFHLDPTIDAPADAGLCGDRLSRPGLCRVLQSVPEDCRAIPRKAGRCWVIQDVPTDSRIEQEEPDASRTMQRCTGRCRERRRGKVEFC